MGVGEHLPPLTSQEPRVSDAAWDPTRYLTFADERARPFVELMSRVTAESPRHVVDLGCGPGNLTRLLLDRWPDAEVLGMDSSPQMLQAAGSTATAGLRYELGDLRSWRAEQPVDVLVSNATLQWVPDHLPLLADLVAQVATGGWFVFQVPGNFDEPTHVLLHRLAADPRFAPHLTEVERPSAHDAVTYFKVLTGLGCRVDAWETTYLHVLTGDDAAFRWVSGTGARPVLAALPEGLRADFEEEYKAALRAAYPQEPHGTLLPFRRVFVAARVP
jgi:trans-aconitate 2-methyltransferase